MKHFAIVILFVFLILGCSGETKSRSKDLSKPAPAKDNTKPGSTKDQVIAAAIRELSNNDLSVDGNFFGLDVRVTGNAASTLEQLGTKSNALLLDALHDSNKFAAAHVMLTRINMVEYQLSAAEWNHLKIDLFADGMTDVHAEQIPNLIAFWKRQLNTGG